MLANAFLAKYPTFLFHVLPRTHRYTLSFGHSYSWPFKHATLSSVALAYVLSLIQSALKLTLPILGGLPIPACPCPTQWLCILHFPLLLLRHTTMTQYFHCPLTSLSPTWHLRLLFWVVDFLNRTVLYRCSKISEWLPTIIVFILPSWPSRIKGCLPQTVFPGRTGNQDLSFYSPFCSPSYSLSYNPAVHSSPK